MVNHPKPQANKPKIQNKKDNRRKNRGKIMRTAADSRLVNSAIYNPQVKQTNIALSKCALKYALAIADPFSPNAKGVCLPVYPAAPSQKMTVFTRTMVTVGANSYGFVAFSPSLANDTIQSWYTNAYFTGTQFTPLSATNVITTGVGFNIAAQIPYTSAQIAAQNVMGRIVTVGFRISYVGTTLNESGSYYLLTPPNHENVAKVANSVNAAGAFQECTVCSITRDVCNLSSFPISPSETVYQTTLTAGTSSGLLFPFSLDDTGYNSGYSYVNAGYTTGACTSIIHFTGVPGSQFLVEQVMHVEYAGLLAASAATPSDSDQRGFEIVSAAAERLPMKKMNNGGPVDMLKLMKESIMEVATALKPYAINALTTAGMALLM